MSRAYCAVSGVVFALVSLLHLWRAVLGLPMTIGMWSVPRSLSVVAGVVTAVLALWALRNLRSDRSVRIAYT